MKLYGRKLGRGRTLSFFFFPPFRPFRVPFTFARELRVQNKDKSSNYGLRGSQDGGQTWSYTRLLLYFELTEHLWACYEIILPEQRLAISSRTFFLKNKGHNKVKFSHFVHWPLAPTDRWIATYLYALNYSTPWILTRKEKSGGKF